MNLNKSIWDYAILLGLAVLLASNFSMTKIAVHELPPFLVVFIRLVLAFALLFVVMIHAKMWFPAWGKIWWPLALSAFFGHTLPFSLLSWSQQTIDAGLATILMATMPLFTLLLAQVFTNDEKPNRYSVAGFAIALVGIIILFGPEKLLSLADQSVRQYAAILAAMSYGINAIVTKSLTTMAWQQTTTTFMLIATLMSLPLLLLSDLSSLSTQAAPWLAMVYSGAVATAFASVIIIIVVRRTGASFLSQINFIIPLIGVAISILFLGEVLPSNGFMALAIILIGVAIARRRPKRTIISINKGS